MKQNSCNDDVGAYAQGLAIVSEQFYDTFTGPTSQA